MKQVQCDFSEDRKVKADVSGLPDGMYFLRLQDGENSAVRKIVVRD